MESLDEIRRVTEQYGASDLGIWREELKRPYGAWRGQPRQHIRHAAVEANLGADLCALAIGASLQDQRLGSFRHWTLPGARRVGAIKIHAG